MKPVQLTCYPQTRLIKVNHLGLLNLLADMGITHSMARYDGYGSCPLTVENGKIVLAEFGYGGKLLPSFPEWVIKGTEPTRLAWILKKDMLPPIYWHAMLKGHEWLAAPKLDSNE